MASGTLAADKPHPWTKTDKFTELSFSWADATNPGTGKVSVKIGDAATSYTVPQTNLALDPNQDGKITNNTTKTINYTLTK